MVHQTRGAWGTWSLFVCLFTLYQRQDTGSSQNICYTKTTKWTDFPIVTTTLSHQEFFMYINTFSNRFPRMLHPAPA